MCFPESGIPMVIASLLESLLPHVVFESNDHREHAPYFISSTIFFFDCCQGWANWYIMWIVQYWENFVRGEIWWLRKIWKHGTAYNYYGFFYFYFDAHKLIWSIGEYDFHCQFFTINLTVKNVIDSEKCQLTVKNVIDSERIFIERIKFLYKYN